MFTSVVRLSINTARGLDSKDFRFESRNYASVVEIRKSGRHEAIRIIKLHRY